MAGAPAGKLDAESGQVGKPDGGSGHRETGRRERPGRRRDRPGRRRERPGRRRERPVTVLNDAGGRGMVPEGGSGPETRRRAPGSGAGERPAPAAHVTGGAGTRSAGRELPGGGNRHPPGRAGADLRSPGPLRSATYRHRARGSQPFAPGRMSDRIVARRTAGTPHHLCVFPIGGRRAAGGAKLGRRRRWLPSATEGTDTWFAQSRRRTRHEP
jgi:hypothetical protein